MDEPWGISEPNFLRLYVIGFAMSLLFAYAVRILTRAGAAGQSRPVAADLLTTDELAYLAGGPKRVVEAAVARLVDNGDLRPSRDGYVSVTGRTSGHDPVTRTVIADVNRFGRRSVRMLVDRLHEADAVTEVRNRLVRSGLVVDQDTARVRVAVGMVPMACLLGIGSLRWLNDIQFARPVGLLTLLLLCSGATLYVLRRQSAFPRTFVGDRLLTEARSGSRTDVPGGTSGGAATVVAVGGLDAYPDRVVRAALVPVNQLGVQVAGGGAGAGGVAANSG